MNNETTPLNEETQPIITKEGYRGRWPNSKKRKKKCSKKKEDKNLVKVLDKIDTRLRDYFSNHRELISESTKENTKEIKEYLKKEIVKFANYVEAYEVMSQKAVHKQMENLVIEINNLKAQIISQKAMIMELNERLKK